MVDGGNNFDTAARCNERRVLKELGAAGSRSGRANQCLRRRPRRVHMNPQIIASTINPNASPPTTMAIVVPSDIDAVVNEYCFEKEIEMWKLLQDVDTFETESNELFKQSGTILLYIRRCDSPCMTTQCYISPSSQQRAMLPLNTLRRSTGHQVNVSLPCRSNK